MLNDLGDCVRPRDRTGIGLARRHITENFLQRRPMPGIAIPTALELIENAVDFRHEEISLQEAADGIAEQSESVSFFGQSLARPAGMLRRQDMALGMGHQAEHSAGRIA